VRDEILLTVQLSPEIQATQLLDQLQAHHPGMFKGNEARTLRRRLASLRQELCTKEQLDLEHATAYGASTGKKLTEATALS
jgi:hypothetical protein